MDVFEFREKPVTDYAAFTRSFTRIQPEDIISFADDDDMNHERATAHRILETWKPQ